ncbi:MAG: hypothetical protein RR011_05375 [Oscillospiraceae bacterium]
MSINTQGVGITKIIYSYSVQICLSGTAAWVLNEPIKDIYRRHDNCRCTAYYKPENGKNRMFESRSSGQLKQKMIK